MRKSNNIVFVSEVAVLMIIIGVIIIQSIGMTKNKNTKITDTPVTNDSSYIFDCEQILSCKNGASPLGKKRMILSTAAKYYHDEECRNIDSTLTIVNVEFIKCYKGYEMYWIVQGSPSDFYFTKQVTNIECMGNYVTLYSIKDLPAISYETIQQMGFNDKTDYFVCQELSWFLLINPTTSRCILVKDALIEQDCESYFNSFIQDKSTDVKVVYTNFRH